MSFVLGRWASAHSPIPGTFGIEEWQEGSQQSPAGSGSRVCTWPRVAPCCSPAGSGMDVMRAASRLPLNDQKRLEVDAPAPSHDDSLSPGCRGHNSATAQSNAESLFADPDRGPKRVIPPPHRLYITFPSMSFYSPAGWNLYSIAVRLNVQLGSIDYMSQNASLLSWISVTLRHQILKVESELSTRREQPHHSNSTSVS